MKRDMEIGYTEYFTWYAFWVGSREEVSNATRYPIKIAVNVGLVM